MCVFALAIVASSVDSYSQGSNQTQERSRIETGKFPQPFIPVGAANVSKTVNPHNYPAVSTGYYFVDSDGPEEAKFKPASTQIIDTTVEATNWRRILPGPRTISAPDLKAYWDQNEEGYAFFRNPALPSQFGDSPTPRYFQYDDNIGTDSTDDAFAGPMPIRMSGGFYFNGIKYDSFYVSTNGLIALTNRRYTYETDETSPNYGKRQILPGSQTGAYNVHSMDWFVGNDNGSSGSASRTRKTADGLTDVTPDDFGYLYSVCGGNPLNQLGGIRARGGNLHGLYSSSNPANGTGTSSGLAGDIAYNTPTVFDRRWRSALITPFFGDNQLSQYWASGKQVDDYGKVFYMTNNNRDKMYIWIINMAPVRTKATVAGNYNAPHDLRGGDNNWVVGSAQVQFNRIDSSITFVYQTFTGAARIGSTTVPSRDIFRWNTLAGVRGFARHVNMSRPGGPSPGISQPIQPKPWVGEYEQWTYYYNNERTNGVAYPNNRLGVKFKQHQNTLRVVDIQYRVRSTNPNEDLSFKVAVPTSQVNDYELLAGEPRIGAIQPLAIIQNLSNDIQGDQNIGTNYVKQDLEFIARFRVINQATDRIVYNRIVPVSDFCLKLPDGSPDCNGDINVRVRYVDVTLVGSNYDAKLATYPGGASNYHGKPLAGIPPYGFVQVYFPAFEPTPFLEYQIGRLRTEVIAETQTPNGVSLKDSWNFDDRAEANLFVMKRLDQFKDDGTEFHVIDNVPMPSVLKWVNIGATMANGEDISNYPLPPRGQYEATNVEKAKDYILTSPVILIDRYTFTQQDWVNLGKTGDEIRSFPVDLRNRYGAILAFSVQRTRKQDSWDRGWSDDVILGAEPRGILNENIFNQFVATYAASRAPDELRVEYARPSDDQLTGITNIAADRWRYHPRRGKQNPGSNPPTYAADAIEKNMSVFAIYGGGGYMRGWLEEDADSALAPPVSPLRNGLRANIFDDGIDMEFKRYFTQIPDTFIKWQNEGAKNFRFRLSLAASNDQKCATCIPDDNDPFYVDNVSILFKSIEQTDLEVTSVKSSWPYTISPATQATVVPVSIKIANNTSNNSPFYTVKVKIYKGDIPPPSQYYYPDGIAPVYCRTVTVPSHEAGLEKEIEMPSFNAREIGDGKYTLQGIVIVPGGDLVEANDTTYSEFNIKFGDVFAYDPESVTNDGPSFNGGIAGCGIGMFGFSVGGNGNASGYTGGFDVTNHSYGYVGGNGSGSIAMKFELLTADTVFGYKAYWAPLNSAADDIAFALHRDDGGVRPGQMIQGSEQYRQRTIDDFRTPQTSLRYIDEYCDYQIVSSVTNEPAPVILQKGVYWLSVSQLGQTNMELGVSKVRAGMRTIDNYYDPLTQRLGASGKSLAIHKEFRRRGAGGNMLNNNYFAMENLRNSGAWVEFMPTVGNPAYGYTTHYGHSLTDGTTMTLQRGFWIPLLRPILGNKSSGYKIEDKWCPDDVPVELTNFDGNVRGKGIDLFWETASEKDNLGFYVEKRGFDENQTNDENWNQVGFVKGNGTKSTASRFAYNDNEVKAGSTYQYRLRQVDFDGTQNCFTTNIVTLTYEGDLKLVLEQNSPNPFNNSTSIGFNLPVKSEVKLEVLDMFGNVISTIHNGVLDASYHNLNWNGITSTGAPVSSGTYIYRLTAGEETATAKMTIVR